MPKYTKKQIKGNSMYSLMILCPKGRGDEQSLNALETSSVASDESEALTGLSVETEDETTFQILLDKVCAAVEALEEKRPEMRARALQTLIEAFRHNLIYSDGDWNYESTFLTSIENILRKGKPTEQVLAAECLSIFSLQLEPKTVQECLQKFHPILEPIVRDSTLNCAFRSACATAVSVLQYLAGYCDCSSPKDLMKSLESVFRIACLKGDGKVPLLQPSVISLCVFALRAWTLVYTFLAKFDADPMGKAILPTLLSLLQSSCLELRITAGETVAIVYERLRNEVDGRYKGPYYTDIAAILEELASDGAKNKSKSDRKKQRQSFREFVDAVVHYQYPESTVSFGTEVLNLSSCCTHFHYDLLCHLLKSGLNNHLRDNPQIRDLFDLGAPVERVRVDRRFARYQKKLVASTASKNRTQKLSAYRDKRCDVLTELN